MVTKKKGVLIAATLVAVVLITLLGARPAYLLYRDVSFYWEDRTEWEHEIKAYAEEMGISYGEYPQSLIDLYGRNPETKAFVLGYPFREEPEVDLSGYENRETVPLFLQWDPMWGYEKYGNDCIAITGCGPTCLAMVGYWLTGDENMTPNQIAQFAQRNGYYASGYGSSWTLISEGAGKLGLSATELPLVEKKMVQALEKGQPVILAMGEGDFTSSGHYIVLTGVTEEGFRVNDPNSVLNSQKIWTYEELEKQIRNIWAMETA